MNRTRLTRITKVIKKTVINSPVITHTVHSTHLIRLWTFPCFANATWLAAELTTVLFEADPKLVNPWLAAFTGFLKGLTDDPHWGLRGGPAIRSGTGPSLK